MDEEILEEFETYVAHLDALIAIKVVADCRGADYATYCGRALLRKAPIRMAALLALRLQRIRSGRLPP
jgi:hypothetical protein